MSIFPPLCISLCFCPSHCSLFIRSSSCTLHRSLFVSLHHLIVFLCIFLRTHCIFLYSSLSFYASLYVPYCLLVVYCFMWTACVFLSIISLSGNPYFFLSSCIPWHFVPSPCIFRIFIFFPYSMNCMSLSVSFRSITLYFLNFYLFPLFPECVSLFHFVPSPCVFWIFICFPYSPNCVSVCFISFHHLVFSEFFYLLPLFPKLSVSVCFISFHHLVFSEFLSASLIPRIVCLCLFLLDAGWFLLFSFGISRHRLLSAFHFTALWTNFLLSRNLDCLDCPSLSIC